MEKIPVIIDTDLTCDDAVALALAAKCDKFDIKAVVASGNADTNTAYYLAQHLGINCTVAKGLQKPLFDQCYDTLDIYGTYGDYSLFLPCCGTETVYADGAETIYREAVKAGGSLQIFTMGPLTNMALAILRYPQIKKLVKEIVSFVGTGYVGNAAPYSEYNAWLDPCAVKTVFESGIPVTMCGLDTVKYCNFTDADFAQIKPQNAFVEQLLAVCGQKSGLQTPNGTTIPAAAAMSCFIEGGTATKQHYYVAVETKSSRNKGWTIVDRLGKYKKQSNVKVVTFTNKQNFINQLNSL